MEKIVITGATSMIGIALIKAAIKDTSIKRIYAVVRSNSEKINRLPNDNRIKIVECDMLDYYHLPELIREKCDVFYHLAWPRTATYEEDFESVFEKSKTIQAMLNAVKAASELGCEKFVGAGSQSEYGITSKDKISPETVCCPVRADGVLHLAAGNLARILSKKFDMSCIWMRIFSVYGQYDRNNSMVASTVNRLRKGEHCSFTKAEQMWDFLNAEDAGRAFYLVGKKVSGSRVYCLGGGEARPLREYIEIIGKVVSPETDLGIGEIPYPIQPVMHLCADISALKHDTGWEPVVDFECGINRLYKSGD